MQESIFGSGSHSELTNEILIVATYDYDGDILRQELRRLRSDGRFVWTCDMGNGDMGIGGEDFGDRISFATIEEAKEHIANPSDQDPSLGEVIFT